MDRIGSKKKADMLRFSLVENGIDSIKHGIEHFVKSDYKYAILHIFHGLELLLKESIYRTHPILIYKNIDKPVREDSHTVGFDVLVVRLENLKLIKLDTECIALRNLQIYRNRIEHKSVTLNKKTAEDMLGESLKFIFKFSMEKLNIDLKKYVGESEWKEIEEIIVSYDERMKMAIEKMNDVIPAGEDSLLYQKLECPYCWNETVLYEPCGSNETKCFFCHEPVYIFTCESCGVPYAFAGRRSEQPCDACWERLMSND